MQRFWFIVFNYFTERLTRKVFFFAVVAVTVLAIATAVVSWGVLGWFLLLACAVAFGSMCVDSIITRVEFNRDLSKVKQGKIDRMDDDIDYSESMFEKAEERYLKRKRREIDLMIMATGFLVVIFVVFLFM